MFLQSIVLFSVWSMTTAAAARADDGSLARAIEHELTDEQGDVTWGYKANDMVTMASRIYGDSSFFNDSVQPVPPVHIIVDNARVTLTGVVDTRIQKVRAGQIARQTLGVFSVHNALRVAGSDASS